MKLIQDELLKADSVIITGHVRPDGDCVGSCLALYNYLLSRKEQLQLKKVAVVLERFSDSFLQFKNAENVQREVDDEAYDLFISLDCGSIDRLGDNICYFNRAKKTINIDHHISNTRFADINHIEPEASSTAEVMFGLFDTDEINKDMAECLYLGIIHDTGVLKYSNTSKFTLEAVATLIDKGIPFTNIIDETFYQKTFTQNKLLGHCLLHSELKLEGKCILSSVTKEEMDLFGADGTDLDGIIDQLRVTKGVQVAILIYETGQDTYKLSMRANGDVNVSEVACFFGGGGHVKAAGATLTGVLPDVVNEVLNKIKEQL